MDLPEIWVQFVHSGIDENHGELFAALFGAVIGGVVSFGTTYLFGYFDPAP